jgi:DNA-binding IclR family transcriptional regulator
MKKLSEKLNKTVTLCVMEGDHIICIDYMENKDTSMFYVRTGFAMPPYATSAGKAIQAYMNRKEVEKLASTEEMEPITPYTKTDFFSLLAELETIRKQGYAVCDEELQLGMQGVACPIFDSKCEVVAAVSFNALKSESFLTQKNIDELKACALAISRSLGYQML